MTWIQTYTGKEFSFIDPLSDNIDLEDIAIALSRTPRFAGHTKYFYSVACHSLLVADFSDAVNANTISRLWGLLHDAHEAYIGDISTPLKQAITYMLPKEVDNPIKVMAKNIDRAIALKLGISLEDISSVKYVVENADIKALATEKAHLLSKNLTWKTELPSPANMDTLYFYSQPDAAESWYNSVKTQLKKYHVLKETKNAS